MPTSRISRIEEKRTKRQLVLVVLGTIVLLFLTISAGIPLLIKATTYIGAVKSNQPIVDALDKTAPFAPTLSSLPTATNTSKITVDGYAEAGTKLKLFVNGKEVKNVLVGSDGAFSFSDITLREGSNTIYATATDANGNISSPSDEISIAYKKDAPKLEIVEPQEGQNFGKNQQEIQVKGLTDPGIDMRINDRFVYVKDDGSFVFTLKLNDGENTLTIIARDAASNETKLERKVTYQP